MKREGKNLEAVQTMNRTLLLRLLQQKEMCSRANLAEDSGLKQATITNIVNDFISWGLVEETGLIEGNKGRRAIGIRLKKDSFYVIGVRLSRKYFEIGLFTLMGELVGNGHWEKNTDTRSDVLLGRIREEIEELLEIHKDKKILAIGVAVPGPYYCDEDRIESVFRGWDDVALQKELQNGFSIPVVVDHDANAGVLAECALSVKREQEETVIYMAVGQGIGAGIYHDGKIFRGTSGIAGEIGHMSINADGILCECGNRGCLLNYASTVALMADINAQLKQRGENLVESFKDMIEPIRRREEPYYPAFKKCMRYLSVGIVNLIYGYNPALIIIGDEMGFIGKQVTEEVKYNLQQLTESRVIRQADIQLTSFGRDSAFIGAAQIAIDYAFSHTELFRRE